MVDLEKDFASRFDLSAVNLITLTVQKSYRQSLTVFLFLVHFKCLFAGNFYLDFYFLHKNKVVI